MTFGCPRVDRLLLTRVDQKLVAPGKSAASNSMRHTLSLHVGSLGLAVTTSDPLPEVEMLLAAPDYTS